MKKFRLIPLFLVICLIFCAVSPAAWALDDPTLNGKAFVVVDLDSGSVLFQSDKDAQRAPASLTKVMTVLLALEALDKGECTLEEIITAPADCRTGMEEDSSSSGILPGAQLSMKDLLYCALLQSANEACNIIAVRIGGSIKDFVELMNQKAAELGCNNTHFMNTNGLPAENHYSSAYDLYLITNAAMSYPLFMEICNTPSYQPENPEVNDGNLINNSNALISPGSIYGSGYLYEGASGVKTGYTRAAGYCLISTAEKGSIRVMAVVMGCDGELNSDSEYYWNFLDSQVLYNWVFDNFAYRTIVSAAEPVTQIKVEMAENDGMAILRPASDLTVLMPIEIADEDIQRQVTIFDQSLVAPIAAGTALGEMTLSADGKTLGSVRLINSSDINLSRSEYMKMRVQEILSKGWVVALIGAVFAFLLIYTVLVLRYRRLRQKHLQERRRAEQQRRLAREQAYESSGKQHEDTMRFDAVDPDERYDDAAELERFFSSLSGGNNDDSDDDYNR